MPIKRCTKNGKSGFKYGDSGTCYTGPGARKKVIEQMKAIKVSQSKGTLAEKIAIEIAVKNEEERLNKENKND